MPREVAKHKELLDDIFNIQNKLDELSSDELLKDEAFRQLSKINKDIILGYKDDIENHIEQRTFKNQKDYQFFKKIDKKNSDV